MILCILKSLKISSWKDCWSHLSASLFKTLPYVVLVVYEKNPVSCRYEGGRHRTPLTLVKRPLRSSELFDCILRTAVLDRMSTIQFCKCGQSTCLSTHAVCPPMLRLSVHPCCAFSVRVAQTLPHSLLESPWGSPVAGRLFQSCVGVEACLSWRLDECCI